MERISLSIPCLVLSSETSLSGETEKHILTPFGYVDIVFPGTSAHNEEGGPFEIRVVGDVDSWMIDDAMPAEFKMVLRKFIVEIIQLCTQTPLPKSLRNSFQVQRENHNIKIMVTR